MNKVTGPTTSIISVKYGCLSPAFCRNRQETLCGWGAGHWKAAIQGARNNGPAKYRALFRQPNRAHYWIYTDKYASFGL